MQCELQEAREQLELRVIERTTELSHVNHDLTIAKETAEAATRAKGDFLTSMTDEIRTSLTAIVDISDLLETSTESSTPCAECIQIRQNANHLLSSINGLLDSSKVEAR